VPSAFIGQPAFRDDVIAEMMIGCAVRRLDHESGCGHADAPF